MNTPIGKYRNSKIKPILDLYRAGHTQAEIARQLGLYDSTVTYYLKTYGTGEQYEMSVCPFCNCLYVPKNKQQIYCCDAHARKAKKPTERATRRARTRNQIVDKDITLQALYIRDNGRCYLCGEKCNWDDIEYKDGKPKAGESYPSIDHIIPLSKGGTQSWENVKLAHRHCNSIKGVYEARRMGTKYSASV